MPCLRKHKPKQASLTLIPGVSIASVCAARLNGLLDASGGLSVRPATSLSPTQPFLQLPASWYLRYSTEESRQQEVVLANLPSAFTLL